MRRMGIPVGFDTTKVRPLSPIQYSTVGQSCSRPLSLNTVQSAKAVPETCGPMRRMGESRGL